MKKMAMTFLTIAALGACSTADKNATDTVGAMTPAPSADTAAMAPTPAAAPAVTDPQIAAIVVAANDADIAGGRLAASKSGNAKVKAFAQRMITDHGGVNKAAVALVTKLNVTPEQSPTSEQQKKSGEDSRASLKGMTGAAFDKAYMANEVTYHEGLLAAIDTVLLPSAQNAELKALLEQTRPAVVDHLKVAKEIVASLGA